MVSCCTSLPRHQCVPQPAGGNDLIRSIRYLGRPRFSAMRRIRAGSRVETCAGRQMCSLTHPSTVKNFPHPHSPLSNSSLTHTHPAQSFPSPALIPHHHHTFRNFPQTFSFVYQFILDYYTLYQTLFVNCRGLSNPIKAKFHYAIWS